MTPFEIIADKIVARYGHPSRTAYVYLFHLQAASNRAALIPDPADVIAVWSDEGEGLRPAEVASVIARCQVAASARYSRPSSPHERRLQMARVITITLQEQAADQILVDLSSRALAFTPKGDRRALEYWRPAEGSWYSAPINRP